MTMRNRLQDAVIHVKRSRPDLKVLPTPEKLIEEKFYELRAILGDEEFEAQFEYTKNYRPNVRFRA